MGELRRRDVESCINGCLPILSSCDFKFQMFVNMWRADPQIYKHPCPLPRASKQGRSLQQSAIFKPRSLPSLLSSSQSSQSYTVTTLHLTRFTGRSQDDSRPRRYSPFLRSCRVPPSSDCRLRLRRAGMVSVLILDPGMIVWRATSKRCLALGPELYIEQQ